jgi:2-methylcitrate dehydratase PrpD
MTDSPTLQLAAYVTDSQFDALPTDVVSESRRAILNYLGCALGGSLEPALDKAIQVLAPYSGPAKANVLGRRESFD